ncbi:MFS transporter [Protaetiibacter intestinalis]|uniref:MFS transporter n=2 Tax=Protaetiibacter intestinalis TaxID=2419774 RepID=A0A387BEQ4_9MICO|nr:MFS transporter [Protaetiibacter intestinalis]
MGLLPQIAQDLLPGVWASSSDDAIAQAGVMIAAYALGVVVGAPTIAVFAARVPRRIILLALTVAFTLGTVASALAPTFGLVVLFRFVAALPHGAYFGIAALVAASLMGPGKRGQGVALVLSGLTVANVVGVPLITALGQSAGWRIAYLVVAAIFAASVVAIRLTVPTQPGDPDATPRRELGAFARPAVWFALLTGSVGFAGFFAVYSYVAPLTTEVTGLPESAVPWALVTLGVGMTLGNLLGGWAADRGVLRALFLCFGVFAVVLLGLALTAAQPLGLFGFLFGVGGAAAALSPAIQTRLMDVAGDSQTLAAAVNHSALNIGNALGAFLGGAVIAAGWGYLAPTWLGLVLCAPGILLALAGAWVTSRR